MTEATAALSPAAERSTINALRETRSRLLWIGIAFILIGLLAIVFPTVSTIAVELYIGWVLILSGVAMAMLSFFIHGTGPFFGMLLWSLMNIVAGAFLVFNPVGGALALTILVAVLFVVQAASEFYLAFAIRGQTGWLWVLASAVLSLLAAILIAAGLPGTSTVVLGLLAGVNFLSTGVSLVILRRRLKDAII